MEMQFIGDDDEIPMGKRDQLWKGSLLVMMMKFQCGKETNCRECNSFVDGDEIPRWNRDKYGNAIIIAFAMEFQSGKETIAEIAIKP